jgi:hypothetical protein
MGRMSQGIVCLCEPLFARRTHRLSLPRQIVFRRCVALGSFWGYQRHFLEPSRNPFCFLIFPLAFSSTFLYFYRFRN